MSIPELILSDIMQALIQIQQENTSIKQENLFICQENAGLWNALCVLQDEVQDSAQMAHSSGSSGDPKISLPDKFDGTHHKFQGFIN